MGAFDLIAKAAKGAKNAPFFSKADVVLDELQRGKGTGDEFLTELVKKGVKPTELKERGLDKALKGKPKMAKAEVQKIFEKNAPPRVQEKVLPGSMPNPDEFLEAKAQELYGTDWFDLTRQEREAIAKMYDDLPIAKYENYKTPGGENYREILLKLPEAKSEREIADENLKEFTDKVTARLGRTGWDFDAMTPEELVEYDILNKAAMSASQTRPLPYGSSHYRDDPNLLAHIRVQDFKTPDGKKVLLVDEIQSDWHQEGRKKGYKTAESLENWYNQNKLESDPPFANLNTDQINVLERNRNAGMGGDNSVPDAPFKKNWHELAMKRVLDYAAENGYDTVAITPGIQQVKRYEDATRQAVDEVAMYGDTLVGFKDGRRVIEQPISSPDELEKYVGRDIAEKLSSAAPDMNFIRSVKGQDLTVGGEGMKGFYDKMLPDYLNKLGNQYGAQVGEMDLITKPEKRGVNIMTPDEAEIYPAETMRFHRFDINPQMREEIKTKGQPLYSKIGVPGAEAAAGTGAAAAGSQIFDGDNEQTVQNPVHFTENPDAMLLELMQRN